MKEEKEFDNWNILKKKINRKKGKIFYKEKEIWWANFGKNIGNEQNGKNNDFSRPILIFKIFNKESFWGLPTSTRIKEGKYYYTFKIDNQNNSVNLSQLRLFSNKRIFRKKGIIDKKDFRKIQDTLSKLIKNLL